MNLEHRRTRIIVVIGCFLLAGFFLFFRLGKGDPVTDEIELAFRAVGYMDFLATPFQTTPLEWFAPSPWWTRLSFHDHPPAIFALGHAVFKLFGDSLLALRVPFAAFGLGSLSLLYLLTRKLFGEQMALIVLSFGALNTYLTWVGRIGLQEELVIFFTLLSLYFLTLVEKKSKYFFLWGLAFSLGLLSKYTAAIILPVSALYLWYFNRAGLKNKFFYAALLLVLLIFSPILIYNWQMFQAVGHFDLQFSSFLGQDVSAHWQSLLGKQIGSPRERLAAFYPNLWANDLPLALFFIPSLILLIYQYLRSRLDGAGKFIFWTIVLYHLLIILIGPAQRFLVMLAPWAILAIAYALGEIWKRNSAVFAGLILILLLYQGFYNVKTNLTYAVDVEHPRQISKLHYESAGYGYNELDSYLRELLDSKKPAVSLVLPKQLEFAGKFREKDFRDLSDNPEANYLIIYDPRINQVAKLWLLDRRYYYDGWPVVSADEYLQVEKIAPRYFADLGITDYFYIASTPETFLGGSVPAQTAAVKFERERFIDQGILPEKEITNRQNQTVFRIYHFSL